MPMKATVDCADTQSTEQNGTEICEELNNHMIHQKPGEVNLQSTPTTHRTPVASYALGKEKLVGKVIGEIFVKHISFAKHTLIGLFGGAAR